VELHCGFPSGSLVIQKHAGPPLETLRKKRRIDMEVQHVEPHVLISEVARELKNDSRFKPPTWSQFVKTGVSKERPPIQADWWYTRTAALLRKVYLMGPIGTNKLRTMYGAKKNNGVSEEHFYKGSGSIIRKILQQCEKAGYLSQSMKGVHKGRVLTPAGVKLLSQVAKKVAGK